MLNALFGLDLSIDAGCSCRYKICIQQTNPLSFDAEDLPAAAAGSPELGL